MLTVANVAQNRLEDLLHAFGLRLEVLSDGSSITGTYWGEPEAGVVGHSVFVRRDTPLHSLLHEASHVICMDEQRREQLRRDAGGDDLEEAAVCYLQILLAEQLDEVGATRLMQDMDTWGYSFRLGSTARWFYDDARDAREWLVRSALLDSNGAPAFRLRRS
jgi:hypothetical protein